MALLVAGRTAQLQIRCDRVAGLGIGGNMVEFEKLGASAIGAGLIPCLDQSALTAIGVAAPVGGVDRVTVRIVYQCTDERLGDQPGNDSVGDGCSIVQGVAVAGHVHDDFSVDLPGPVREQVLQPVRILLSDAVLGNGRRRTVDSGFRTRPHHPRSEEGDHERSDKRWQAQREQDHAIRLGSPSDRPLLLVVRSQIFWFRVAMQPRCQRPTKIGGGGGRGDVEEFSFVVGSCQPGSALAPWSTRSGVF